MINFEIEQLDLETQIPFYKIKRNGRCIYDEFYQEVHNDHRLSPKLDNLLAYMQDIGNLKRLPKERYRIIQGQSQKYKISEVKVKPLRLYLMKINGYVIVCGGAKDDQKFDTKRAIKIAKEYEDFRKQIN